VGARDRKKHKLFGATAYEPEQKRGHILKKNRLADHEHNRSGGIAIAMMLFKPLQSRAQKMEHQKKIRHDQNCVHSQLDRKRAQSFSCLFFHLFQILRVEPRLWSLGTSRKVKSHCDALVSLNVLVQAETMKKQLAARKRWQDAWLKRSASRTKI
jgi:hypothetical protein